MENKSFTRTPLLILIIIIFIALIIGAFLLGKQTSVPTVVIQESSTVKPDPMVITSQPITPSPTSSVTPAPIPSIALNEIKTYKNDQYGLSFHYPSSWIITDNPSKKSISIKSDTTYSESNYSMPAEEITITSTNSSFFNPQINTKYGSISYDNNLRSLVDNGEAPARCMPATPLFGSTNLKGITYSGSNMSTPAYSTSAVITSNGTIFIVNRSTGGSNSDPTSVQGLAVIRSLILTGGNTATYPTCALQ